MKQVTLLSAAAVAAGLSSRPGAGVAAFSSRNSYTTKARSSFLLQVATSSSSTNEHNERPFLGDGKGHINPELAQRIWKWEQEQRLPQVPHYSTREGLRWVQDCVAQAQQTQNNPAQQATDFDDLIQDGVVALMQAMKTYEHDARPNESFQDYCLYKIQLALSSSSSNSSLSQQQQASSPLGRRASLSVESTVQITDPMELRRQYSNQDDWEVRQGLVLDTGTKVQRDQLVEDFLDEALQYEGEDLMWIHQQQVAAPLRDSIQDDGDGQRQGPSRDDLVLADMIKQNIDEFLGTTLDEEESQVIQLRFGLESQSVELPKTQKEVAFDLGMSVSKVRKLQKSALEKLRTAYTTRYVGDDEYDHYWEDSA